MRISFEEFVERFQWESETQKKGFLSFAKELKDKHIDLMRGMDETSRLEYALQVVTCWFIQKDHEANEWYNERIGDLDRRLVDMVAGVVEENRQLRGDVEELKAALLKK